MKRIPVQPLLRTPEDNDRRVWEWCLRAEWFFLGLAAFCVLNASTGFPGYWQTAGICFLAALIIHAIKRRLATVGGRIERFVALEPKPKAVRG